MHVQPALMVSMAHHVEPAYKRTDIRLQFAQGPFEHSTVVSDPTLSITKQEMKYTIAFLLLLTAGISNCHLLIKWCSIIFIFLF